MISDDSIKKPSSVNYIKIINWFWDEVPHMIGYKAAHAALFFAIVDCINRNNWANNTPIAYDRLIYKVKFSKQVYLDSRIWLLQNDLIELSPGQNAYHMAVFNLGLAVRNQTANLTANDTTTRPVTLPLTLPIIKHINKETSKPINNTPALPDINIPFDDFWILYDKKVGKEKCMKLWNKLSDKERLLTIKHVPKYKESKTDKQFIKDPATYLNNKSFNDEIIINNGNPSRSYQQKSGSRKRDGISGYAADYAQIIGELEGE